MLGREIPGQEYGSLANKNEKEQRAIKGQSTYYMHGQVRRRN
jgi:hypothetical protein